MPEQRRNSAMIGVFGGEFQRRYEAAFAWKSACSAFLALPGLRGFWPMSSFNEAGNAYDLSGQGRVLTYNGDPTYNYDGLAPYIDLDGTGDFLSRADEAGLDILGTESYVAAAAQGLTLGGWFWSDVRVSNSGFIVKYDAAPATSSFALAQHGAANQSVYFQIYNGALLYSAISANNTYPLGEWNFIVGRFAPNSINPDDLVIFLDGVKYQTAAATPAAINNSAAPLEVGRWPGVALLDGRASLCCLCAAALSDAIILSLFHQTRAAFGI